MTTTHPTQQQIEPGIYRRWSPRTGKLVPTLWIHYPKPGGGTVREPANTTTVAVARKLRAKRLDEVGRGVYLHATSHATVNDLLDAFEQKAIRRGRTCPRSAAT
jgi:hypothetical protein